MKKSAISNEEDEALAQYNINLLIMADSWVAVHRDKLQEIVKNLFGRVFQA